jgi:hypothetical protein
MKKSVTTCLAIILLSTGMASAAGLSYSGNVQVFESGTRQYMQANMSVRHNTTAAGSPYVLINGYANSSVTFAGRDGNNTYFSCYVPTTSPLYTAAVDAKNNFNNGARLYIYKQLNSSECESFSLGNYSYFLD